MYNLELIAQTLLRLAGVYKPNETAVLGELFAAGKELNDLLKQIRQQTEEEAPEVWAKVREDFAEAVEGWEQASGN